MTQQPAKNPLVRALLTVKLVGVMLLAAVVRKKDAGL